MDATDKLNLSLNGCGYLGIYHVGVCGAIRLHYPKILSQRISGGSVGALVACAFMCKVPLEICARYVLDVSARVRGGVLGPMSPDLDVMRLLHDYMSLMLPEDAAQRCDGKLYVSVTRVEDGKNVLLSSFDSRDELLQALMCSCFIPVYCGYEPPMFRGVAYVDAALSNNSPCLDEHTVTVAPFCGHSDICPDGPSSVKAFTLSRTSIGLTGANLAMLFRVLFPGPPDLQKEFCQRGYNDGLRFLRDRGLIPCSECRGSTNHSNCKPPDARVPNEIAKELELAVKDYRERLGYRLLQYRSMKLLYYINMPSIVTAKVAYAMIAALLQKVQNKSGVSVDDLWRHFLQVLKEGLYRPNSLPKTNSITDSSKDPVYKKSSKDKTALEEHSSCETVAISEEKFSVSKANDVKVSVPQTVPNNFPGKTFSKTCQLDFPLCENSSDMAEMMDTYIY